MAQHANWRDELATDEEAQNDEEQRPLLSVASLTPADTATVRFLGDGEKVETEFDDRKAEQLRIPVVLEEVDGRIMTGDDVPADTGEEYVILTGAKSFINPLAEFSDLEDETVAITSAGTGQYDGYEVYHDG